MGWTSGRICLNLLNEPDGTWHGQWSPSITIKQILCAIQELLDNPFPAGARPEVQTLYERNRPAYERRLRLRRTSTASGRCRTTTTTWSSSSKRKCLFSFLIPPRPRLPGFFFLVCNIILTDA